MANTKSGYIRRITPIQEIVGKSGKTFTKRTLVLDAARYDQNTGEKMFDNYPSFEFSGEAMSQLDKYNEGDAVTVSYDINGREFEDPNTHEVKYFNTIRGYKIEPYGKREEAHVQAQEPAPQGNAVIPGERGAKPTPEQAKDLFPQPQGNDNNEPNDLPF